MGLLIDLALKAKADLEGRSASQSPPEEPPVDSAAEARRRKVLAMLEEHPEARYAALSSTEIDPEAVLLTLAIRGVATLELRIPREKWDGVLFLELLERNIGTVH